MEKGPKIGSGRTAEIFAWGESQVLKLFYDWVDEPAVAREASLARSVQASGAPCPAFFGRSVVEGRLGLIYEWVRGPSMLAMFPRRPWRIPAYGRLMAALHAQMHACRVPELPTQRSMFERRSQNEPAIPDDLRLAALESLPSLPEGDALCHGDFHPDNIILSPHGPVILDWMTASRGCPAADVARTLLLIRIGEPVYPLNPVMTFLLNRVRNAFVSAYLKEYRRLTGMPQADIDAWRFITAVARLVEQIPGEREKLLAICRS